MEGQKGIRNRKYIGRESDVLLNDRFTATETLNILILQKSII